MSQNKASAATAVVDKESGQAADTLVFQNIKNMYARMYSRWRIGAIWLINQDIERRSARRSQ